MRTQRGLIVMVAMLGSLAGAVAQDSPAPAEAPAEPAPPAAASAPTTAQEQIAAGEAIVRQAGALSQRIGNMLEQARRDSDVIRVTCLNDKLTQVNTNLRTASKRLETLQSTGDPDLRAHESTVLSVLGKKFQVLDQEAGQCVGQDMFDTGTTRITTEIDEESIPDESPSDLPMIMPPSGALLGAPPPPASRVR